MSLLSYYVVRYATPALYTFEFVVVLAVWILVLTLWRWSGDTRSVAVYVIGGLYDAGVELAGQTSGVRAIPDVNLFGAIHVGRVVVPFILGFFEGGVLLLVGYDILRGIEERDTRAMRIALIVTVTLCALITLGAALMRARLGADPQALTMTTRALFSKGSLVILVVCYALSLSYVCFARNAGRRERKGLLIWYGSVVLVAALWYTPMFVFGGRVIASLQDGTYVPVSLIEQIAVLYGFSIIFEAAGFYLPVYVIIRLLRLI